MTLVTVLLGYIIVTICNRDYNMSSSLYTSRAVVNELSAIQYQSHLFGINLCWLNLLPDLLFSSEKVNL